MKYIFIINPVAGKGISQHQIINNIEEKFKTINKEYEIHITQFKGDAKNYVLQRCSENIPMVFIACGGDGTLQEVVNAAFGFNHVSVGVIPCGSGNDFVRNFENYFLFNDIDAQINGKPVLIDLLEINNKYSVSVCNIGLDADAAFNMVKFKKIPFIKGTTCYILSVLYCLFKELGKNLEVEFDQTEKLKGTFLIGVQANGKYYGGGYKCAPLAKINDGIMDVCFIKNLSRLKILMLLKSYKNGTHLQNEKLKKCIVYKKCKMVKIKSDEQFNYCIDGENIIADEIKINILNNALNFWIPENVSLTVD